MSISIVVATDIKGGIGKDNKLPWDLPSDIKHFRDLITDKIIVMGRKTFESVIKYKLPCKESIILSRNEKESTHGNHHLSNSFENVLKYVQRQNEEVFIIGGAEIYNLFLPYTDTIYLTEILEVHDCDTFFPLDLEDYVNYKVEDTVGYKSDESNKNSYMFRTLKRIVDKFDIELEGEY